MNQSVLLIRFSLVLLLFFVAACNKVDVDYSASTFNNLKFQLVGENSSNSDIKLYRNQIFTIDYRKKDKIKNELKIKMEYSLIDNSKITIPEVLSEYKTEDTLSGADELLKFKIQVQPNLPNNEFLNLKIKFSTEDNSVEFIPAELVIKIDNSTMPPSAVVITSPPNNSYINVSNVGSYEINGTCEIGNMVELSSSSPQTLVLFPGPIPCPSGTFTTGPMDVSGFFDGSVKIDVKQKNTFGEVSPVSSLNVIKDTVLPTVSVTSHSQNAVIDTSSVSTFTLSGTCSEENKTVQITGVITPVAQPLCSAGAWSVVLDTLPLPDGDFNLNIKHLDLAGNESISLNRVLIKSSSGIIALIGNKPNLYTDQNTFNFNISGSGITAYKYALGKGISCSSAVYSAEFPVANSINRLTDSSGNLASAILDAGEGDYRLCVLGKNASSIFQSSSSASTYTWTYDISAPSLSLIDDGSYYNSNTNTPLISWFAATDTVSAVAGYEIAIGTTPAGTEILNWTDVGSATSYSNAFGLVYGNKYYASVKAKDLAGNVALIQGDGWWAVTPLELSPLNLNLITGESYTFSATNGKPSYVGSSLLSLINSSTLVYSVPLTASPGADTVTVVDSAGQSATANVNVRAFQDKASYWGYAGDTRQVTISDIKKHPDNSLFAIGSVQDNQGNFVWATKKSVDNGLTWVDSDIFMFRSHGIGLASGITFDNMGNIYVVGYSIDASSSSYRWVIRKSVDVGNTWTTLHSYQYQAGYSCWGRDIVITDSGVIITTGAISGSAYLTNKWAIFQLNTDGSSVNQVDFYSLATSGSSMANGVYKDASTGYLYAAGYAGDSSGDTKWTVKKSVNSGLSWSVVESYGSFASSFVANKVLVDPSGAIHVAGYGSVGTSSNWIVRTSNNGGASWAELDNFQLFPGYESRAMNLTSDSLGKIYVVGYGLNSSGVSHLVLRKFETGTGWVTQVSDTMSAAIGVGMYSSLVVDGSRIVLAGYATDASSMREMVVKLSNDSGTTWTTNSFHGMIRPDNVVQNIKETNSGIFAIGYHKNDSFTSRWIVRKSSDSGATWNTSDEFFLNFSNEAVAMALAESPINNNLYTSGFAIPMGGTRQWIVRRSSDAGASWVTKDTYSLQAGYEAIANDVTIDSSGNIFVVGEASTSSSGKMLVVRKSSDQGDTWSLVKSYNIYPYDAAAKTVLADSGNIFVGGYAISGLAGNFFAQILKSSDGGISWSVADSYQLSSTKRSEYNSLVRDSSGNLYASGTFVDSANVKHWLIRKSIDGGNTWTTTRDIVFSAGYDSEVHKLTADFNGNIYAAGEFGTASGRYWQLQKSNTQGNTWTTIDKKSVNSNLSTTFKAITPCLGDRLCSALSEEESVFLGKKWRFRFLSP